MEMVFHVIYIIFSFYAAVIYKQCDMILCLFPHLMFVFIYKVIIYKVMVIFMTLRESFSL